MKNILVSDIMTRYPITASPETTVLDCARLMVKKKVGSVLLVKDKYLVGILSEKDILWALIKSAKEDLSKIRAIDISPKKIATIKPDSTISETMLKMNKLGFERLPVISNNELVGMITAKDILNFHPELYPELEEFAEIREEQEKINRFKKAKERATIIDGICEECGSRDVLYRVNGLLMCENCRDSL